METYTFAHLPTELQACHAVLLENISADDASSLRRALVAAGQMGESAEGRAERERLDFAFVDARMVASREQLLTAVHSAVLSAAAGQLKTPKVHSDIIWALSLSPNIADALRTFGVVPTSDRLLIVKICSPAVSPDAVLDHVKSALRTPDVDVVSLDSLSRCADWRAIRKAYKLDGDEALRGLAVDDPEARQRVLHLVTTSIGGKAIAPVPRAAPISALAAIPPPPTGVPPSITSSGSRRAVATLDPPSPSIPSRPPARTAASDGTFLSRWLSQLRPPLNRSTSSPLREADVQGEKGHTRPGTGTRRRSPSSIASSIRVPPSSQPPEGPSTAATTTTAKRDGAGPPGRNAARGREVSLETEASSGPSKMRIKNPIFRRRSAASALSDQPTIASLGSLDTSQLTPNTIRTATANSTPLGRPSHLGPFSPPLYSGTPTEVAPVYPASVPSTDVLQLITSLTVMPAIMTLQQLSPAATVPQTVAKEGRQSISTAASRSTHSPIADAAASQISLPESGGASIISSSMAPHSMVASLLSIASTVMGEQLAASSLAIPATSFASLFRTYRNLEWIAEHAEILRSASEAVACHRQPPLLADDEPMTTFEFGSLLQSVADTMAAYAAQRNVELVIQHADPPTDDRKKEGTHVEAGFAEIFVRATEPAVMLAISLFLQQVVAECSPLSSIEIILSAARCGPLASTDNGTDADSLTESVEADSVAGDDNRAWNISLELLRTSPNASAVPDPQPHMSGVKHVSATLLQLSGFTLTVTGDSSVSSDSVAYHLVNTMPMGRPKEQGGSQTRRSGADQAQREPSRSDLIRFAETSLKGKKVVFHASERSIFAKQVTKNFANWGTDISYSSTDVDEAVLHQSPTKSEDNHHMRQSLGRYDSGFASAGDSSPNSASMLSPIESGSQFSTLAPRSMHTNAADNPLPIDPSVNLIVIDDDVPTLKRQLVAIRNNPPIQPHLQSTLLSKRPQLHSRRTRSSAHMKSTAPAQALYIVHFASLAQFRTIREVVRGILRSASPLFPLPEVLVIPKPVGPRRLLTVLHTAVKRPSLDPAFAPIATSPASPGGHYFFSGASASPRASPAAVERHFDFTEAGPISPVEEGSVAAAEQHSHSSPPAASRNRRGVSEAGSPHSSVPATPPSVSTAAIISNATVPTPVANEALEYFTSTAAQLGAGGASGGIVIQSPDGRPTGLFFQPSKSHRSTSLSARRADTDRVKSGSVAMEREKEVVPSPPQLDVPTAQFPKPDEVDENIELPPLSAAKPTFASSVYEPLERSPLPSPTGSDEEKRDQATAAAAATADQLGVVTPQHLGLGQLGRASSEPVTLHTRSLFGNSPPLHAVRLDSYQMPHLPEPPTLARLPTAPAKFPTLNMLSHSDLAPAAGLPVHPEADDTNVASRGTADSQSPPTPRPDASAVTAPAVGPITTAEKHLAPPERRRRAVVPKADASKKRAKATRKAAQEAMVPSINVLIVEDNRINQTILSTFMKRKGIRYGVANNGQEAVDMWKTGGYHLVLMDIQLPIKSGIEATMEIRELERRHKIGAFGATPTAELSSFFGGSGAAKPESADAVTAGLSRVDSSPYGLPVIIVALTASSEEADRVAALAAGCNDFLTKPVGLPWLQQKLLEWGSMQLLAGFPRRQISKAVDTPAPHGVNRQLATLAHQVAHRLHLDAKRPTDGRPAQTVETDQGIPDTTNERLIPPTTT